MQGRVFFIYLFYLIATFAAVFVAECTRQVKLWNIPLGDRLIVQPWILEFDNNNALINSSVGGLLAIILSLVERKYSPGNFGDGWSVLWK